MVESDGGLGSGMDDQQYREAGARIVSSATELFASAELLVKVKEPQPQECKMLRPGQILFTYLHLAPDPQQAALLLASDASCIAYETVSDDRGGLPLLSPMSEVAGRLSIQAGAWCLQKSQGGSGLLLGGVPGVAPAQVLIIGGGVVGINAARIAMGMGARVTVLDRSLPRLRAIDENYRERLTTLYATADAIEQQLLGADLVVGAVLVPGAAAPRLVSRADLSSMKPGSVLVDVAIDQGGCFETSKPTTHLQPIFQQQGIVHYCVANMPSAVARTATLALTNATLPYVIALANKGVCQALLDDKHLLAGLTVYRGKMTVEAVASALGYPYVDPLQALA
jgi:alanine dehydrogenase